MYILTVLYKAQSMRRRWDKGRWLYVWRMLPTLQ